MTAAVVGISINFFLLSLLVSLSWLQIMPKFGKESLKISKEQRKTHVKKPKGTVFSIGLSMRLFHDQSYLPLSRHFFCPENVVCLLHLLYSKPCLKQPLKNRQNKDLNDKLKLNEGQKYSRMLPLEHSAILLTCIKQ